MSQIDLNANKREALGKSNVKRLKKTGWVPGVVYHRGEKSLPIEVFGKELFAALHTDAGRNVLINLKIHEGKTTKRGKTVVVKELAEDPVKNEIIHVDFHQISLKERIVVNVPVVEKGEAPGVKNDGGILEVVTREIQVECLPTEIPEHFEIDVSKMNLNQAVHISDLALPPNVVIKNDPAMIVLHVVPPKAEKAEEEGVEGPQEPEVIGEKKDEEGEADAPSAKEVKEPSKEPSKESPK